MYHAYCDGYTHRPSGLASVAFCFEYESRLILQESQKIGKASIHEAEYRAILMAMEKLISLGVSRATLYSDDALVINQVNDIWIVDDGKLKPLYIKVRQVSHLFEDIHIKWIPEMENGIASNLSKTCFTGKPKTFSGAIEMISPFQYRVKGRQDYIVDMVMSTCTCPAYRNRSTLPCKHIIAVREHDYENDVLNAIFPIDSIQDKERE